MVDDTPNEFPAEEPLRDAGFTVREARFAAQLIEHSELAAHPDASPADVHAWIATFLPPPWICRLLANHVTDPDEGVHIYERAHQDPRITRRLDLRADALDANCRDQIVGPRALIHRLDATDPQRS